MYPFLLQVVEVICLIAGVMLITAPAGQYHFLLRAFGAGLLGVFVGMIQ